MAFTVQGDVRGRFTISTGDGHPVVALTVDEVCAALRHHYAAEPGHGGMRDSCPFCRWMRGRGNRREVK